MVKHCDKVAKSTFPWYREHRDAVQNSERVQFYLFVYGFSFGIICVTSLLLFLFKSSCTFTCVIG